MAQFFPPNTPPHITMDIFCGNFYLTGFNMCKYNQSQFLESTWRVERKL